MKLKNYQQNTLDILQRFFENCRIKEAKNAYKEITSEPEIAARLGVLRSNYEHWNSIPNTPRVCLKIPTGGGKTIIAAYAIKIISDTWCEKENPVVLWFCPSDTIRKQTSEALKNPRHPYRIALNEQFGGRVRIFDIDEKFNIRPADIENNACVIVSTIQAFRQSSTNKYNVYRHNENLEPHFTHITAKSNMETDESGNLKFSFVNLLHHHRPIVIVDEAHNVISGLSQEMQGRINPSALVELTATPRPNNNTLYNVRATELKEEEMIKLPIELREHLGWEQAVAEAILKRAELEKNASNEPKYIRPILLFQAQDKSGEVNVETLKKHLIEVNNIPANEIAIATGEQKELDGIDVFARNCEVKYIITVEALKEGWDCSFAYVLCSLANVQSNTAIEQLLGRVMRMPYAESRKAAELNKAYAYVISKNFGEATNSLVDKLIARGFDETEAAASVETVDTDNYPSLLPADGLFWNTGTDIHKINLPEPMQLFDSSTAKWECGGKTFVFTPETTDNDVANLMKLAPDQAPEIQHKYNVYKQINLTPSPAKQGESFAVPKLMVELQGEFVFAEPDTIFEAFNWNIAEFASPKLESFKIEPQGNGFVIDIDGNNLKYTMSGEQLVLPLVEVENWTKANLVAWLDKKLQQNDISQPQMLEWLRQMIEHLTETNEIKLSTLMLARYVLVNKIRAKIETARNQARKRAFQQSIFARESRVTLNFDNGFKFFDNMYDGELCYQGKYKFAKHFLGAYKVPIIDGDEKGEEFACARAIDTLPQIKYWLRNVSKHKNSFCLPTSTDKFYPDFVAMLNDGRILVVEYKGAHLTTTDDTKEKRMIGELWEKHTGGKGLFLIAEKLKDGLGVAEQIERKVAL